MKALIASLAALGLMATPALATSASAPAKSTKTIVTKGPKATATTTVTTKVAANTKTTRHAKPMKKHAVAHKTTTKAGSTAKKGG
jgi:hypothetical protein